MKLQRISIEMTVFLMIALVAFGGFTSLGISDDGSDPSISDDSGNELTGNKIRLKKPKFIAKVQKAIDKAVKRESPKPVIPTSSSVSPSPATSSPTLASQTAPAFVPQPITCKEYSGGTANCAWNCEKTDNSLDIIYGDRGSYGCKKNEYCCAYQGNKNKPNSELTCKQAAKKEGSLEGKCATNPNAYSPCAGAYPWSKSAGIGTQGRKTSDCQVCCIKR
jgi:hypothetical protein